MLNQKQIDEAIRCHALLETKEGARIKKFKNALLSLPLADSGDLIHLLLVEQARFAAARGRVSGA